MFIEPHESLLFTAKSRSKIVDAGKKLNWDSINPDILGSMLQAVAAEDIRSHLGMHYTSVPNIMKVIKPLFLDELRSEFDKAKGDMSKLQTLYDRLGKIKFMDPACGSGNFLVVTYKELRQLEIDILKEENNLGVATMYIPSVTLNQFYGIEIDDFACDVARLSLWIAEHQMNKKLSEEVADAVRPTLPLQHVGGIVQGNALRLNWDNVMPIESNEEVYLFGNPPYLGAKWQSEEQKNDLKNVFGKDSKYKKLDYISGWFEKGTELINQKNKVKLAFVTTNSITQGEQVSYLWKQLLKSVEISFAYQSFMWKNNAKNNAGVSVEIIGLRKPDKRLSKAIYSNDRRKLVKNISPYITESENYFVEASNSPLNNLPRMVMGSMPRDGGNLILSEEEKRQLQDLPLRDNILRKYVGANELLNGKQRYCLWMNQRSYIDNCGFEEIKDRVEAVKHYRENSKAPSTKKAAQTPWAFVQKGEYEQAYPGENYEGKYTIVVPKVSSGNRLYVPIGLLPADNIVFDKAMAIYNAEVWILGLLQSRMHLVWLNSIGGKLKMDFSYSSSLVYNTFPVPDLSTRRKNEITDLTLKILDIRNEEGGTLAELYGSPLAEKNPKPMNSKLLKAHRELDQVVDRAYKASGFKDDRERLTLLLKMYADRIRDVN
ncbi:class I SAM-dependent DNA methyltransferase [Lactobacillus delbrueckii]|uniref:class I SAM-dependent DNA methyltransferase n=1 Tax=Lactobacillus delbrueckii TaxID=1584 RepID=UPI002F350CD2